MKQQLDVVRWRPISEPSESQPVSEPSEPHRDQADFLRHNFLARRRPGFSRPTIPTGDKVRAGLGYPATQKLMPNLGRPWTTLGT
jgi:hypothetical protein